MRVPYVLELIRYCCAPLNPRCRGVTVAHRLEHTELSQGMPEKVAALTRRIEELKQSAFTPVRCTGCDDGFGNIACGAQSCHDARACEVAMNSNGGFWGPFQE